jgi:epoxyqueuosine reductase
LSGEALAADLRRIGLDAGLDAFGIAGAEPFAATRRILEERRAAGLAGTMQFTYRNPARSSDPSASLAGARSLIVGARRYLRAANDKDGPDTSLSAVASTAEGAGPTHAVAPDRRETHGGRAAPRAAGRVARYAWRDHYGELRESLGPVVDRLRSGGHRTLVLIDDNSLVDRAAAARAGIGWYGKNTTMLLPGSGSWYVLGTVVTDAVLPVDEPIGDGCGPCSRCLPACPTGALVEPGVLDARRCLAWLVQAPGVVERAYREAIGDRIYGCDDCQDVCPVNRAAARRDPPAPAGPDDTVEVDVVALLRSSDAEILRRYGRWYIADRNPGHLRRNALIVLGNTAAGDDTEAVGAIAAALAHPDAVVRAHAVWAAARLGRRDLLGAVEGEGDPRVRAELDDLPAARPARRPDGGGRPMPVELRRAAPFPDRPDPDRPDPGGAGSADAD